MSNDKLAQAAKQALETLEIYVQTYNDYWERGMDILEPQGDASLACLRAALAAHDAEKQACQGANCGATDGRSHSRECIEEAAATQGWTPTEEDFANCPPQAEKQAGPVAGFVPAGLLEAVDSVLEEAHCECPHSMRYARGEHLSGCWLFDLNIERGKLAAPPSPLAEQDKEDAELLDWLGTQVVELRKPLRYGSERTFIKGPDDNDGESVPWDARAAIRAARAKKEQP